MNRPFIQTFHLPKRLWAAVIVVAAALLLAGSAAAIGIGLRIIYTYVPAQNVDLDGDGDREHFSGELTIYDGGMADGRFLIAEDLRVEQHTGEAACVDGEPIAKVRGTLFLMEGGESIEIGDLIITMKPARGGGDNDNLILVDVVGPQERPGGNGGGGGIDFDFDIINNVAIQGSMIFEVDPCDMG